MNRYWAVLLLCGSASVARSADKTAISVSADRIWIERSRAILESAQIDKMPDWILRGQTSDQRSAANDIAVRAGESFSDYAAGDRIASGRIFIFASLSVPEATLRALLVQSQEPSVTLVLRGVPKTSSIPATLRALHALSPKGELAPSVIIDPTLFEKFAVTTVPTFVMKTPGGQYSRVRGAVTTDWLRRQDNVRADGGNDFGLRGETYPIAEPDLIVELQQRMAAIDWSKHRDNALQKFWSRPHDFAQLPAARTERRFLVDPTIELTDDISDLEGHVLLRAGTRFNPLAWVPLRKTLVVFDGTDRRQVAKAVELSLSLTSAGRPLVLLTTRIDPVRGWTHISDLEKILQGVVYVLPPALVERLRLTAIPATVEREDMRLAVHEYEVGNSAK